jgi:hypothetical protein
VSPIAFGGLIAIAPLRLRDEAGAMRTCYRASGKAARARLNASWSSYQGTPLFARLRTHTPRCLVADSMQDAL